jgi:hypothetical protein
MGVTRRHFVLTAAATLGIRSADPGPSGPLSAADLDDLLAFTEILVEEHPLTAEAREHLREYLGRRVTQDTTLVSPFRVAARLLDRLAGRRFSSLDFAARSRLVVRHGLDARGTQAPSPDGAPTTDLRPVRERVVPELIRAFYASPAGWAVVGYSVFPGRCGDLGRYTRPEP